MLPTCFDMFPKVISDKNTIVEPECGFDSGNSSAIEDFPGFDGMNFGRGHCVYGTYFALFALVTN